MRKLICLLVFVLLVGCTVGPPEQRFFTGTDGVEMDLTRGAPPSEIFYREGDVQEFEVEVLVKNEGASLSKGGVYLSGYDPTIIDIEEIDEDRDFFDSCRYDIRRLAYGDFDGYIQCRRIPFTDAQGSVGIGWGDLGLTIDLRDFNLGGLLDDLFDISLFEAAGFTDANVRFTVGDGGTRLDVKFDNPNFDADQAARGPYFLKMWEPIDFTLNGGMQFGLKGDTPNFPGGEETFINFHGTIENMPDGRDQTRQQLLVTSCYLYTTHASPLVCIDQDPYGDEEKACRPRSYASSGQGAPVAITSVSQRSTGNDVVFRIVLQNVGRGTVYNPLRIHTCSPYYPMAVTEQDLDVVVLGMVYVGDEMLDCVPESNTVRLYEGRGVVNCVMDLEDQSFSRSGYETPLVVEAWYGYSETVRHPMTITRI